MNEIDPNTLVADNRPRRIDPQPANAMNVAESESDTPERGPYCDSELDRDYALLPAWRNLLWP